MIVDHKTQKTDNRPLNMTKEGNVLSICMENIVRCSNSMLELIIVHKTDEIFFENSLLLKTHY